jgi:hypothetical protein
MRELNVKEMEAVAGGWGCWSRRRSSCSPTPTPTCTPTPPPTCSPPPSCGTTPTPTPGPTPF